MNLTLYRATARANSRQFFCLTKPLTGFLWLLIAGWMLVGCEAKKTPAEPPSAAAEHPPSAAAEHPLRVVASPDLPEAPERIVSLAPNVTEVLFALGAGSRVVAVTRFDDYPPRVKSLPKIGGIIDVDLEAVLAQKPDLVVGTSAGSDADILARLDRSGIAYVFVQMNNLPEIYAGIEKFGEVIAEPARAAQVTAKMKAQIEAVAAQGDAQTSRPGVLMVYGHDPLVAAGPGSFGHDLLTLAGGQNVLADAQSPYPTLDIEKILSLNPDVIIDATVTGDAEELRALDTEFWAKYDTLAAVREERVHYFEDPVLLRPAPRLVEGLKLLRAAIAAE